MFRLTQMSIHVLRHVPADCLRLQRPAEDFSCFWGENALKSMKKLVKTQKNPLVNVTKALKANGAVFVKTKSPKFRPRFLHRIPALAQEAELAYRGVQTERFRIVGNDLFEQCSEQCGEQADDEEHCGALQALNSNGTDPPELMRERQIRSKSDTDENAYFYARGHVYKAFAIWNKIFDRSANWHENVVVEAHKFRVIAPAYYVYHGNDQIPSSNVGIFYVSALERKTVRIPLKEIEYKCVSHLIAGMRYAYKLI